MSCTLAQCLGWGVYTQQDEFSFGNAAVDICGEEEIWCPLVWNTVA